MNKKIFISLITLINMLSYPASAAILTSNINMSAPLLAAQNKDMSGTYINMMKNKTCSQYDICSLKLEKSNNNNNYVYTWTSANNNNPSVITCSVTGEIGFDRGKYRGSFENANIELLSSKNNSVYIKVTSQSACKKKYPVSGYYQLQIQKQ